MTKHIFTCLNCGHITEIKIRKLPEIETEGTDIIIHIQGNVIDNDAYAREFFKKDDKRPENPEKGE